MIKNMITQNELKNILDYNQETGVFTNKINRKKWRAKIKINYKSICLGHFDTEQEAHEAYIQAVNNWTKNKIKPKRKEG